MMNYATNAPEKISSVTSTVGSSEDTSKTSLAIMGKSGGSNMSSLQKPLRLALMKAISSKITDCEDALSVIPLLQVLLVILAELDGGGEEETAAVETMVTKLLAMITFVSFGEKSGIFLGRIVEIDMLCTVMWR